MLEVKRAYRLTVDQREAPALDRVLRECPSAVIEPVTCPATLARRTHEAPVRGGDALSRYDDNRNGRITCTEARRHGIAPVHRSPDRFTGTRGRHCLGQSG